MGPLPGVECCKDARYFCSVALICHQKAHLDNSGIIGQTPGEGWLRFGRLTHSDVLDVGASEDDVLVNLMGKRFNITLSHLIFQDTSSLGATGRSVGLASVPKDLTGDGNRL